jgi:predicted SprT family Zn-dependent metalloprotease
LKRKYIYIAIPVVVFFVLLYLFLFGGLFPFSPVAFGFQKYEQNNTIVYIQNGSIFKDYQVIDSYPQIVEVSHHLKFSKKPKIFIFSDENSYLKRARTNARFIAYPDRSLMASPWAIDEAQEGAISLEIYLKHELSHILLYQNMGLIADFRYPKWLMEGIAMYTAEQMGTSLYPSKRQVYELIREGNYFPPQYYKTSEEEDSQLNLENKIAFLYSEFACIVDYLIERYGEEKFHHYMTELFTNTNHDAVFKKVFNLSFSEFQNEFVEFVRR